MTSRGKCNLLSCGNAIPCFHSRPVSNCSIDRRGDARASVIEKAQDALWERSDHVEIEGQSVISNPSFGAWFTAPGGRSHPMVPFDDVRITVTGDEAEAVISYELSTHRMLLVVGMMASIIVIGGEVASIGHEELWLRSVAA
jgi:hypothetical protein